MRIIEIIADLPVDDIDAARDFSTGYLGLSSDGHPSMGPSGTPQRVRA